MSDSPRVYVASLSDYNAARLHGVWIDADQDADAIHEEIRAMLAESHEPIAEEWAIHDHENFGSWSPSEYESIETVAKVGKAIAEHGEAVAAYIADAGGPEYLEGFEESYQGEWKSEEDFAYELAQDCWYEDLHNNAFSNYIDWEKWTRDLFMGDYWSSEAPEGGVYVFRAI